jgi:hypothetical protein
MYNLLFRPTNGQYINSNFYFLEYFYMFRRIYAFIIFRKSFRTYANVTKSIKSIKLICLHMWLLRIRYGGNLNPALHFGCHKTIPTSHHITQYLPSLVPIIPGSSTHRVSLSPKYKLNFSVHYFIDLLQFKIFITVKYSKSKFSQNTTNFIVNYSVQIFTLIGSILIRKWFPNLYHIIIDNKLVVLWLNVLLEYLSANTSGWLELKYSLQVCTHKIDASRFYWVYIQPPFNNILCTAFVKPWYILQLF